MSILGKDRFQGDKLASHIMNPNDVMNVTGGAPTPWNPGDRSEIRSEAVRTRHRNFSESEVADLRVKAAQRQQQARLNAQGYQAMKKIEQADRKDHTNYRNYQTTVAKVAAGKKQADVSSAKAMNGVATQYAKMGYSLGQSNTEAQVKVAEFRAMYTGVARKWA